MAPRSFFATGLVLLLATTSSVLADTPRLRGLSAYSSYDFHDVKDGRLNGMGAVPQDTHAGESFSASWHEELLAAVNTERAKANLPALCQSTKLTTAAQKHSDDMAGHNYMSHYGSGGSTMMDRIKSEGFAYSNAGENVAAGQHTVETVMTTWMNSPGHRANILGDFKYFGAGRADNSNTEYKTYWTQVFGDSHSEACACMV
ncbi:hypothetical protein Poli38472_008260 [Pythium oligandrum]|uniref:SCP domain-containing protein n=1 Tax=Pythium oligandrum TaxID=41045 RepID=A0A8K1CNQ4_PYTOL|nr:hypothetical protein Poli38472_008260 [Pythium oligandrum]|eukprot:TMW65618.1 hypothetical protein Poli38472_008260 [Pythium oligandrum]